ncbi:MAG: hypothetical protein ACI8UO_004936 [Verrucomicrobiales bacterium]|jgi:hypothetical protein
MVSALFASLLVAQSAVTVDVQVEPESVTVAEQLLVKVSVTTARNPEEIVLSTGKERAFSSDVRRFSISGFDRRDLEVVTTRSATSVTDTWIWRFDPGLPGESEVPALTILSRPTVGSGQTVTTTTEPIAIEIRSILPGEPLKTEIRPSVKPRVSWLIQVSIVVMGVVWILALVFLRDRGPPPPPPDPSDIAREQLLATLDSTAEPEPIRAAVFAYESTSNSKAAAIWSRLDEIRFARSEEPVSDELKSEIRAFAELELTR